MCACVCVCVWERGDQPPFAYFDIRNSSLHSINLLCLKDRKQIIIIQWIRCITLLLNYYWTMKLPSGQKFCCLNIRGVLQPFTVFDKALNPMRANIYYLRDSFSIGRAISFTFMAVQLFLGAKVAWIKRKPIQLFTDYLWNAKALNSITEPQHILIRS